MTAGDPLSGLDDVPWADLKHCFGAADDVPGHLRAVRAGGQEGRYPAIVLLWNNVVHQGTRAEATVHTIPFLVRMALDSGVPDRHRVVGLLGATAIGLDNNHLPDGYDPSLDRAELVELRGQAGEFAQWIAEAEDEKQGKEREAQWAELLITAEAGPLCYRAVRDALPALAGLLKADGAELRAAVANLLAWFPEYAPTSIPLLTSFVADEGTPAAAATGLVALGLLGEPSVVPSVRRYLDSPFDELRWASAFALTRLGVTDPGVTDALTAALAHPPARSEEMMFLGGDHLGLAAMALTRTPAATTPRAIDAMLAGLANRTDSEKYYLASELFTLVFPADACEVPRSFGGLSRMQQRVIRFVAEREPSVWPSTAMYALRQWNIPTLHADLRTYVGAGPREQ
ncbi:MULTISPECIES: HEAT repeat domain-containing protein [unclassified Streptomyces]|uniref:HEAT repeat domain-containing protein n=1 Tax=unclassified Streptomyces TaxID=2593676 RepID=UPI002E10600A|nr:HEAT repeat domain-containing protein [Streptomyces sp. NBC_01205]